MPYQPILSILPEPLCSKAADMAMIKFGKTDDITILACAVAILAKENAELKGTINKLYYPEDSFGSRGKMW